MGEEIQAHEEEEHGHGEACEHLGALEPERMPHAAAGPHVEVTEHVDGDAQHSAQGVEEDEVRERGRGERALRAPKRVGGYRHVTDAPPEARVLLPGHAPFAFR